MSVWYTLWFGYVWPSLKGNGPEAIFQSIVYGMIAFAVYPPLRDWAKRESAHIHGRLDHIILHHPDIPPYPGPEPK